MKGNAWLEVMSEQERLVFPIYIDVPNVSDRSPEMETDIKTYIDGICDDGNMMFRVPYTPATYKAICPGDKNWHVTVTFIEDNRCTAHHTFDAITEACGISGAAVGDWRMIDWYLNRTTSIGSEWSYPKRVKKVRLKER